MTTTEIITALNQAEGVPYKAILAAIENRKEMTPALLALAKNFAENYTKLEEKGPDALIALALLAQFRETEVFESLLKLGHLTQEQADDFMADFADDFTSLFVSTYNGNFTGLTSVIEDTHAYVWFRVAALNSLLGLFAIGKLTRAELISYYRKLLASGCIEDENFTTRLVEDIFSFYPKELENEVKELIKQDKVNQLFVNEESIDEALKTTEEEHLQDELYSNSTIFPLYNAFTFIEELYEEEMTEEELEDFMATLEGDEEDEEEEEGCCSSDDECC
jgi:hypothetical protein